MFRLTFADSTTLDLPPTLAINRIQADVDYEVHRAPFSTKQILSGDGLPKAEEFTISGTAYFPTNAAANEWIMSLRTKLGSAVQLTVEGWIIFVHAIDLVVVPKLLPRILDVTIRVYPSQVINDWVPGVVHEYRFDEGSGSVLTDYAGDAPGVLINAPTWTTEGLALNAGSAQYVEIGGSLPSVFRGQEWTQFVVLRASSASSVDAGIVAHPSATALPGAISRDGANQNLRTVVGSTSNGNRGGNLFTSGYQVLHFYREGMNHGIGFTGLPSTSSTTVGTTGAGTAYSVLSLGNRNSAYLTGTLCYYLVFNRRLVGEEFAATQSRLIRILNNRGKSIGDDA